MIPNALETWPKVFNDGNLCVVAIQSKINLNFTPLTNKWMEVGFIKNFKDFENFDRCVIRQVT